MLGRCVFPRHETALWGVVAVALLAAPFCSVQAGDDKLERGRMENIMNVVACDIQKNFYYANLKKVDGRAITERARQRIRRADHLGDMVAAIAFVPYQLNDSRTLTKSRFWNDAAFFFANSSGADQALSPPQTSYPNTGDFQFGRMG